jgi:hypothetical protein
MQIITYLKKTIARKHSASDSESRDFSEILAFFKHNQLAFIPYEFTAKYNKDAVVVYTDHDCDMRYVLHENKRLYFPAYCNGEQIQEMYANLLMEQDSVSPHCYETPDFKVKQGDIIADIGAAEGIFALSTIEKVGKVYLFESEEPWIKALKMTFAPWMEKVVIVNKYVSDYDDDADITMDSFLDGERINFIKVDIEGAETRFLKGAKKTFSLQDDLKIAICTYHRENDATEIEQSLVESGFKTEFSRGYLMSLFDKNSVLPHLRKALIRAVKIK